MYQIKSGFLVQISAYHDLTRFEIVLVHYHTMEMLYPAYLVRNGGILDAVVTRSDLPAPDVSVIDVSLSDHRMVR